MQAKALWNFIADRLQEKGLITREIDPANRRAKIVTLTEHGLTTRHRIATAMVTEAVIRQSLEVRLRTASG